MKLLNPKTYLGSHPDDHTNQMMASIIDWFEKKGLKSLKADWHNKTWNYDFVEFMKNYLFNPAEYPEIPRRADLSDDSFLFRQGPTRGLGKIRFHDYQRAYGLFDLPNIEIFKQQVELLKATRGWQAGHYIL